MRLALCLSLCAGLIALNLSAGVIEYSIANLSPQHYRYNYSLTSVPFLANQELDIRFDPNLYGTLSNQHVGNNFSLVNCCQPNNPPGTFGDYIAISLADISAPQGTFSVDFAFKGTGQPGGQPYFIYQLGSSGEILSVVSAQLTSAPLPGGGVPNQSIPEPATFSLLGMGLVVGGCWRMVRRQLRARAPRV
jgi:hypothetical protein